MKIKNNNRKVHVRECFQVTMIRTLSICVFRVFYLRRGQLWPSQMGLLPKIHAREPECRNNYEKSWKTTKNSSKAISILARNCSLLNRPRFLSPMAAPAQERVKGRGDTAMSNWSHMSTKRLHAACRSPEQAAIGMGRACENLGLVIGIFLIGENLFMTNNLD